MANRLDIKTAPCSLILRNGDAALAYDIKAKELFGNFAYLNFPEGVFLNESA